MICKYNCDWNTKVVYVTMYIILIAYDFAYQSNALL